MQHILSTLKCDQGIFQPRWPLPFSSSLGTALKHNVYIRWLKLVFLADISQVPLQNPSKNSWSHLQIWWRCLLVWWALCQVTIRSSMTSLARGSQEFKNYPGLFFFSLRPLYPPPPAFQTRYVFIQKWYVFPTLLLKEFLAVLLVGCKPFPGFKWI